MHRKVFLKHSLENKFEVPFRVDVRNVMKDWHYMALYGTLWHYMALCGTLWHYMGTAIVLLKKRKALQKSSLPTFAVSADCSYLPAEFSAL